MFLEMCNINISQLQVNVRAKIKHLQYYAWPSIIMQIHTNSIVRYCLREFIRNNISLSTILLDNIHFQTGRNMLMASINHLYKLLFVCVIITQTTEEIGERALISSNYTPQNGKKCHKLGRFAQTYVCVKVKFILKAPF